MHLHCTCYFCIHSCLFPLLICIHLLFYFGSQFNERTASLAAFGALVCNIVIFVVIAQKINFDWLNTDFSNLFRLNFLWYNFKNHQTLATSNAVTNTPFWQFAIKQLNLIIWKSISIHQNSWLVILFPNKYMQLPVFKNYDDEIWTIWWLPLVCLLRGLEG